MANHAVNDLISYSYPAISAEPIYRQKLVPYLDYLRKHSETLKVPVLQADARPFYYNLNGYLLSQGYDPLLHWIIMLMSDIESPMDFDERVKYILVPSISIISEIETQLTSLT